jgi:hypothetical protein
MLGLLSLSCLQLGVTAIGHIRIVPLVLYWVFTWLAQGPKAKERVYQQQFTTFGTVVTVGKSCLRNQGKMRLQDHCMDVQQLHLMLPL